MQDTTSFSKKYLSKKKLKSFKTRGEADEESLQFWEFTLMAKS